MKKGFSLAEVMIIFTLLSVVLAATIPVITKKSNPVPKKISHGVYRCINTEEKGLVQELYSGTRRIKREEGIKSCSFNVPRAPHYKVDMYSAGSGGTEYGIVNSTYNDQRTSYYTMEEGLTGNRNPIIIPGENELFSMFNGRALIRSIYTGDAGDGGNATLAFESPYYARCGVDLNWYKNKIDEVSARITELEEKNTAASKLRKLKALTINDVSSWGTEVNSNYYWYFSWDQFLANGERISWSTSMRLMPMLPMGPGWGAYFRNLMLPGEWRDQTYDGNIKTLYDRDAAIILDINRDWENDDNNYDFWSDGSGNTQMEKSYKAMNALKAAVESAFFATGFFDGIPNYNMRGLFNQAADEVRDEYFSNPVGYGDIIWEDECGSSEQDIVNLLRTEMYKSYIWNGISGDRRVDFNNRIVAVGNDDGTQDAYATGIFFKYYIDRTLELFKSKFTADNTDYSSEIEQLKKYKKALEDEYQANDYVKDNKWANSADNSYTFNVTYGNNNLENFAANDHVRGQIEHFCRYAFNHYFGENNINPANTISFDTRYKGDFGADRGRGAYSRIKFKINYIKKINKTTMTQYLQELVSTTLGGYYPVDKKSRLITEDNVTSHNVNDGNSKFCDITKSGLGEDDYENKLASYGISTCKGDNGKNRTTPTVKWRINASSTSVIDVMTSLPKGGEGKHYDIKPNGYTDKPTFTVTRLEDLYQVFAGKNYANLISENEPKTTNAVFVEKTNKNYYITDNVLEGKTGKNINESLDKFVDDEPVSQTPRMVIESKIWTKTYEVGDPGDIGKKQTFEVTNLGSNCAFSVPAPGKPFRFGIDNENSLKKLLTTTMVCKDKDGNVVQNLAVEGNEYKPNFSNGYTFQSPNNPKLSLFSWNNTFVNGLASITSEPLNKPETTTWKQSSLWAKVYKKFMTLNSQYDLQNKYRVGHAGAGTTLVDKCLTRRGSYTTYIQYLVDYYTDIDSANDQDKKVGATNFSTDNPSLQRTRAQNRYSRTSEEVVDITNNGKKTTFEEGMFKGFDCYGVEQGASNDVINSTTGQIEIKSNSDINKQGVITIKAGNGGGGAVVITW